MQDREKSYRCTYKGVLLVGPMCSGKTTLAGALCEKISQLFPEIIVECIPLSKKLKQLAIDMYYMDPIDKDRRLLVKLAAALRSVDDKVFINNVIRTGIENNIDVTITDDGRSLIELESFRDAGFLIVGISVDNGLRMERIKRLYPNSTSQDVNHPSEMIWESEKSRGLCHLMITNDTVPMLESNIDRIVEHIFAR